MKYRIRDNGCWLASGEVVTGGYIRIRVNTRRWLAHRYVLSQVLGRELQAHALHHCDTPACVNPDHLYEGTDADNMRDRDQRGRQARGSTNGRSKLTPMSVVMLRHDRKAGLSYRKLGIKYGISSGAAGYAATGRNWKVL